jgi:Flp pilus assembly protein TadD
VLLRQLAATTNRPEAVIEAIRAADPSAWRDRGWMLYQADAYRPAFDDFSRALEGDPRDRSAIDGLVRSSTPADRRADARAELTRLASDPSNEPAKLALSRLLAAEGAFDEAVRIAFSLVQSNPNNVAGLEQLASILSDVGDQERMAPVVARLRTVAPGSEEAHYQSAALLFLEGRMDLALREARTVIARNPAHAKAQNIAGACLANLGERELARAAFEASIAADPKEPATYTNLALLELESGNAARAEAYFAEALTIDPSSQAAIDGLERARSRG